MDSTPNPGALPLDAWGMPIIPPELPVRDTELGWTCDEDDIDGWEPRKPGVSLGDLCKVLAGAALSALRYQIIRSGIYRRKHP
jgi:hypothetical protein